MSTAAPAPADNPFVEFHARYANDPVLFVREVFGVEPDEWQCDLMRAVARGDRRISVRSGHGIGKTTCLAWIIIWWQLTRFPQKTVATAPTSAQLFDALFAEVKAWLNKLPTALFDLFDVRADYIALRAAPDESFASFRTSSTEKPEALAGIHSEHVLLVCDEASGIPEPVYESAAGSMSGHSAVTILAGNPVRTSGLFHATHTTLRDLWTTFHVSCLTCKRVSADFVEDMRRRYGELSNAFRVRVLGEFPAGDDDVVIPYDLAEAALKRDVQPVNQRPVWGLDVARFGSDSTALAKRKGNVLREPVKEKRGYDTMQTVGWVKLEYDETPLDDRPVEILVDVIGYGAGVVDRGRELNLPVRGINVSESPALVTEKFVNLRAELWFRGRRWLEKRDCNIANDEGLLAELVGPRYRFTSSGKTIVESKDDMRKRGLMSPNKADAFLLTLAGDAISASSGSLGRVKGALKRAIKGVV